MLRGPITEKATNSSLNSRFKEQDSILSGNKEHKKIGLLCPTEHWSMLLSVDEPRPRVAWIMIPGMNEQSVRFSTMQHTNFYSLEPCSI